MKKAIILSLFAMCFSIAQAQTEVKNVEPVKKETILLKETEFDFAKIPQGKPVYHVFEIVNTSNKPIKLDNVTATCGCTTPEWSKDEIAPGATTKIKVGFNAAADGPFTKPITITYNGNETKQFIIKGEVWKAPTGAAPANSSVQFLKQQTQ
jgi:hypothetical protein